MKYQDFSKYKGVIIGTGPSLTEEQLQHVHQAQQKNKCKVFGVNNIYQIAPWIDVFMSCNIEWWEYYWNKDPKLKELRDTANIDMWTWDKKTSQKYELNHVPGEWGDSFSTDPSYIHYGHASGFQILNLAYHYGIREFILLGYDMRYGKGYKRNQRVTGEGRHYFGEYPKELLHWPMVGKQCEFTGLLGGFSKIDRKELDIRIINCSPGSALDFFEVDTITNIL